MKIIVISGSAHADGASTYLADRFVAGAHVAGQQVDRYNVVDHQTNFVMVAENEDPIPQDDDCAQLLTKVTQADLVVLVTPVYYYAMSSLLKTVVDRFYDINTTLKGMDKQIMMLATAYDPDEHVFDSMKINYRQLVNYLGWHDAGTVWDHGALTHPAIDRYGQQAYDLGAQLKD